jgi:hypothetical protein
MRETTFVFGGCYASTARKGDLILDAAGSLDVVADYCRQERTVAFVLNTNSRTYDGHCGNAQMNIPSGPTICSTTSFRTYTRKYFSFDPFNPGLTKCRQCHSCCFGPRSTKCQTAEAYNKGFKLLPRILDGL